METWKPVVGFEGIYDVSSHGRVRSVDRIDPAGRKQAGQLRRQQVAKRGGYLVVNLRKNRKTFAKKVHHLVALAFNGPPPLPLHSGVGTTVGFCEVDHDNNDKTDNRSTNLKYLTRSSNIIKSYANQRRAGQTAGENNGRAKLTATQANEIRTLYANGGTSIPKLALRFGVGKSTIGYIVKGDTWKH